MRVQVAGRSVPCEGEVACGDRVVHRTDGDTHLIAVVDALGHGAAAAEVADAAASQLTAADVGADAEHLMWKLHRGLAGSRGAAVLLLKLAAGRLEGCSVGNVQMRSVGLDVPSVLSPGILGVRVRKIRSFEAELRSASRLVLFSDGVSSRFDLGDVRTLDPTATCDAILAHHRRAHDDATVVVGDLAPDGETE